MADVKLLKKKSYLAMVLNAARGENHMFQNFFIVINGEEKDSLRAGAVACGTFVSSVLYLQNSTLEYMGKPRWIQFVHARVVSVEKDMQEHGWIEIPDLRVGALITWEPMIGSNGEPHLHIGFYIGNERAISNGSRTTHMPEEHHYTYDGTRKIIRIWWHPSLEE